MTDRPMPGPVPDVDPVDELASALVDAEATPAEQARAADPAVAARVDAFREVSRLVATPVEPPSPERRDAAVVAALAALDEPAEVPASVASLATRRAQRLRRWLPAAAAAAVVIAGFGVVAVLGTDDDDGDVASVAQEAGDDTAGESVSDGDAGSGVMAAPDAAPDLAMLDLGAFDDVDTLLSHAAAVQEQRLAAGDPRADAPTTVGPTTTQSDAEESAATTGPPPVARASVPCVEDPSATTATATVGGRPVVVAMSNTSIRVFDANSCEVLAAQDG